MYRKEKPICLEEPIQFFLSVESAMLFVTLIQMDRQTVYRNISVIYEMIKWLCDGFLIIEIAITFKKEKHESQP